MKTYQKLLLKELRLAIIHENTLNQTDDSIIKAITVNENLASLGYALSPVDIIKLSKSDSLDSFYDSIKNLLDDVKAKPMYPNFPSQVMKIDEAQFRFHQLVHYFSTYGIEELFGVRVSRGWLPEVKDTEKTQEDSINIPSKVIELVDISQAYTLPMEKILSKRERMTLPEKEIVNIACQNVDKSLYQSINIPFKENMLALFYQVFDSSQKREDKVQLLHSLCQHTGDVFRGLHYTLNRYHYRLKTNQQKLAVQLLESYPVSDFKANLFLSHKKVKRTLDVLKFIEFNTYSKSDEHLKAVAMVRNGELKSWEGMAKYLLSHDKDNALDFISQRPGMMLRMVAWLLRLGYTQKDIENHLTQYSDKLSPQTLTSILNHFGQEFEDEKKQEKTSQVYSIVLHLLENRLKSIHSPIHGKKVFVKEGIYSFKDSIMEMNSKSEEGGYVRSGLAYKIPENVRYLRFFVYWNDKKDIDIDLHSFAQTVAGENLHVGWYGDFNTHGICTSGDITHSDAAEFIDVDLNSDIKYVSNRICIFRGASSFKTIAECYVGMMAVHHIDEHVKLYSPKNCFFSHQLRGKQSDIKYGYIDVPNRIMRFVGKQDRDYSSFNPLSTKWTLEEYIKMLCKTQECEVVDNEEDAEVILRLDKGKSEKEISLIDVNYFLED